MRRSLLLFSALLSTSIVAGCAKDTMINSPKGSAKVGAARFEPIRDIPIPAGATLDNDRSLILSTDTRWTGRLVLKADPAMSQLFAYYGDQMRGFGWQPVASIMGGTSVLTFVQGDRAATVQISNATLGGSVITVTMAPRQSGQTISAGRAAYPDRSIQADQLPPVPGQSR